MKVKTLTLYTFIGEFYRNKRHGKGKQVTPNYSYSGTYQNNLQHGYGTYETSKMIYKGEFSNNTPHGYGTMKEFITFNFTNYLDEGILK